MPAHKQRDRLVPYRVLTYILYMPLDNSEWLERVGPNKVRVYTGPCSRQFRLKVAQLWELLFWMGDQGLVTKVQKDKKRGSAVLTLKQPTNIQTEGPDA